MNSRKRCRIEDQEQQLSHDTDENKVDFINTLSFDSLAEIFMLLPIPDRMAMEQVCSKWKEASVLAWHDIKKYKCSISLRRAYDNRMLTQSDVEEILLRCGKYLNELILSKVCNSSIMPIVVEHCKNLTKLEFEINEHLSDIYNINDFVDAFTQLDKLVYIKINMIDSNVPMDVLDSFPETINEIQIFYKKFANFDSQPLFFDLKRYKKLNSLTLNGCMLDKIIQDISEITALVYLDISNCMLNQELSVLNQLINLEHLTIMCRYHGENNGYVRITPQVLSGILNACKNLKYLHVSSTSPTSEEKILFTNWINLKNLEYLDSPWLITDESVVSIVKHCQNLKNLKLDLSQISELSTIKLTELKNLESFILNGADFECKDKLIIAILNNCKKLKCLEIPYIEVSSGSVFDGLSKLQYIEQFNLGHVYELENSIIIAIANYYKNLKYLDIRCCNDITETGLMALTRLENLEVLSVIYNPNVTDNFISKLKNLKSLMCGFCPNVTDVGIIQLIKNCPDLEFLYMHDNSNITIDTIIAAVELTKNRINDIVLELYIYNNELIKSFKTLNKSPWLALNQ